MQASPSKARAQAVESHSWAIVLSWLSTLYHPLPRPTFEQNASTLKALQSLMTENIAADRLRKLLFEAKCEELATAEPETMRRLGGGREPESNAASLLFSLENSLSKTGSESLDSLAASAVLLGCTLSAPSSSSAAMSEILSAGVFDLAQQASSLEDHISSIEALTLSLQGQTTQTLQELSTFRAKTAQLSSREDATDSRPSTPTNSPSNGPGPDFSHFYAQTLQHQRETQQLQLKSVEYKSRIGTLESQLAFTKSTSSVGLSTTTLSSKIQLLHEKQERIRTLEVKFKEFHSLPPDIAASRREVQRFQRELDNLKTRRDELFESM